MFKILEHPKFIPRPIALVLSYPALDFNFTSWMTPENLRVVQHEHSSMDLPGLAEQKDHFTHISPLAVVDDKPKRSETNGNESLWDNLSRMLSSTSKSQDSTEGNGSTSARPSRPASPGSPAGTRRCRPQRTRTVIFGPSDGSTPAVEYTDSEQTNHRPRSEAPTSRATSVEDFRSMLANGMSSEADIKKRMEQVQIVEKQEKSVYDSKKIPIGTRLTMTSRTGYFQDRIISPSMMRAMAILYIGPLRLPNFATDYYISPILAPATLLAQFPITMINCGEKDPFVDDTVIFAGRLREAKRARRREVERALGVKVVREDMDSDDPDSTARIEIFSETSTSGHESESGPIPIPSKLSERVKLLLEMESDWVEMKIIEGWSHGYLQMLPLMHDVAKAIDSIGRWMTHEFERHAGERQAEVSAATVAAVANGVGGTTMGSGRLSEHEDKDEVLMFTPKKRRSPPSSFSKDQLGGGLQMSRRVSEPVGNKRSPESSSEETLIGVVAAAQAVEAGLRSRSSDARKLRRPSEPVTGRGKSPLSPKPLIALPIKGNAVGSSTATRTATPNASGAGGDGATGSGHGGMFLTEGELMKRRRIEAVYGLVADDRVAGPLTPESETGK
ncbi:hypothetical protein FRC02_005029 [Tulasnella sp. 418]|nr:hypothetical protein FRC02_005029 [Tulasnella sp. 418]